MRKTLFGSDHGPNRENAFLDPATDAARIPAIFVHPDYARRGGNYHEQTEEGDEITGPLWRYHPLCPLGS